MGNWRLCHLQTTLLGPMTSFCNIIFAASFLQCNFDSQKSFSFSISVKTTGIDYIAVLADSNQCKLHGLLPRSHTYQKVTDFVGKLPTVFSWCSHSSHAAVWFDINQLRMPTFFLPLLWTISLLVNSSDLSL